jgi:hypothetical protein
MMTAELRRMMTAELHWMMTAERRQQGASFSVLSLILRYGHTYKHGLEGLQKRLQKKEPIWYI